MISVAVMAHRNREQWVPGLVDKLGDAEVVWDRINDRHETGLRAMLAYDPAASHHLIVQDDAVLCRDFRAGVDRLTGLTGEHPVGLYVGNVGPQGTVINRMSNNALSPCFIAGHGPHWGVAIVLPTAHVHDLAQWYERQTIPNYDRRVARWYDAQGIDCWYTAPSLVEHRAGPSLVRGRNGGRKAAWFIGEEESALDVEWRTEPWQPAPPGRLVEFRAPNGRVVRIREGTPRFDRYAAHPHWTQIGDD